MIGRLSFIATCTLIATLGMGAAFAQDDSVLQRYDLAVENLEFAVAAVPGDGVQARDELERAVNALLTLSRDATSTNLVQAMERTFERARTAVENQSRTDLAVQSAVLRGGFRRLVMDSAFTAAAQGDDELARERLVHIGRSMNFTAADLDLLASAADAGAMRLAFESGAAAAIATELAVADRLQASDRDAAYVSLATAYGDSLLIQDSPRADQGLNKALTAAAQALVNNDGDGMSVATETAEAQLSRLSAAARTAGATPAGSLPTATPAGSSQVAAPTELPDIGLPQAATTPAPVTTPPATQPGAADAAAAAPAAVGQTPDQSAGQAELPGQGEQTDQDAVVASLDDPQFLALAAATIQQRERDAAIDRTAASLRSVGLNETAARAQATLLVEAGFDDAAAAVDSLAARVSTGVAALRAGDAPAARTAVAGVDSAYKASVSSLLRAVDGAVAQDTEALLASLATRPVLREHDLTLLASQVDAVARALTGRDQAGSHALELMVDEVWSGWVRLGVFVVLGIFAFVPLRYLNMAFGGGNANWRLVSIALFLLLVPIIYEALAAILSVAADLLDMPALDVLASWSMFSSTTGQVAWAALLFIALLLATIGLRGVCIQFGLLGASGGRTGIGTSTNNPTVVDMTRASKPTAVDWDDEF